MVAKTDGRTKRLKLGNRIFSLKWGDRHSEWGRFGGGWRWALGFAYSPGNFLLNLLFFSIMIFNAKNDNGGSDK